ncbi:MAG: DNA topoisomerase IV subunit A [Candidatus Nitrospinota bacterium M3_3B_026]
MGAKFGRKGKEGGGETAAAILKEELESRFLAYALSTIVSRALPDVRDGLKPAHRRVLYAMGQMKLDAESRFRKSAAVVGDVIGKYHPHGDQAVYDTMVRLAQDFSLRYPLVEGQGNFGNIDGDSAAAMRYTEARLSRIAGELLRDLKKETVDFAPTYDETNIEPKLLPARFPNLLVNGAAGIAVGLATNIPPHNLTEVINALTAMIDDPKIDTRGLLKHVKGPDFPTGGQIIASKKELLDVYETGKGSIRVRGEWNKEDLKRGKWLIVITSIPYTVNKSRLIEKIAEHIISKKLPAIVDIRDESTEKIRIVLEPKSQNVDPAQVMSYIYKHSDLQINFPVNMTALTPDATPLRHSLMEALRSFLDFRLEVTENRLTYELRILRDRLHILQALMKVYKDLDAAIAIIRKSKTRDEARMGLKRKFGFDDTQANAILDLRLAALVSLEISKIRKEKASMAAEAEIIESVLKSPVKLRKLVRKELAEIRSEYGDERRTKMLASAPAEPEWRPETFIESEETNVIVSRDGWVRRMKSVANPLTLRFKEGDSLLSWIPMNTRDVVLFFTSAGKVYGMKAYDIQQTTGFGDPVQAFFRLGDGERLVSVIGLVKDGENGKKSQRGLFDGLGEEAVARIYGETIDEAAELMVITEGGMGFRFSAESLGETNKNGKKIASVKGDDAVFSVFRARNPLLFILSSDGRGLLFGVEEVSMLSGPGAGVRLMKLKPNARVLGALNVKEKDTIALTYYSGKDDRLKAAGLEKGLRGQVGRKLAAVRKKLLGLRLE